MRRLVGALVLFSIVAFGLCLILPFISRLRGMTAKRIQCANNLKQFGIALRNYHDVYGSFPSGTIANESLGPNERLSWIIAIFPFLERDYDYQRLDMGKAWNAPKNYPITEIGYGPYRCHESPDPYPYVSSLSSYVGMAGIGPDAALLPLNNPKAGLFGYDRKTKCSDVQDGESTTIMVVETNFENGPWAAGGFGTVRGIDPNGTKYFGTTGQFGSLHRTQESSPLKPFPPQASNCVFVDGSVRLLNDTIDPTTFEALATIAGGEKVELPLDY
jgi:hypothetical protein